MATFTRQPFGEISTPRLQALGSSKNRQNALSPSTPSFACPLKPSATWSIGKRQRQPEIFDEEDCENTDPAVFSSPTKKSRTSSDGFVKPARFSMVASPARSSVSLTASPATSMPSIRKSLSSPNTAKSTPISHSRGSPKNKRLHAVSKRRASSSPFRRVDPPSFSQGALPFSIDAALSGTISNYTPKSTVTARLTPAPQRASALEETMPKSWFFEIHEDTPEQEAANLMEHSASVLDISSDDDAETKAKNEELSKGKENIPPPDFALVQPRTTSANAVDDGEETEIEEPVKRPRLRKIIQDAMDEDRRPLGDLSPTEFYGEGCDASSYVTVDAGIERPSRLSKEVDMEPTSENVDPVKKAVVESAPAVEETVAAAVHVEEVTGEAAITSSEKEASTALETTSQADEATSEPQ
ncbi:hypothetical protein BU25DRAFT_411740 [Macroventuria anomochaeta]|uniref:Uncharacterized protein n=1 Tax=Macroventuria anomochaeta TaxID=301207 RepID=A0ACB6RZG9_9PLEO|nr:uncharacterized protein BU25DRAFT_411740 [Macroventuria anomochaeta]KAF2626334.1 hypothetical protein BU25DRAFT_411740 [Macroventuria anomochaeta]